MTLCYTNEWGGMEHIPTKKIRDLDMGGALYECDCGKITFIATD
jgi:hypothetical protein